jgi:hypothetical protein
LEPPSNLSRSSRTAGTLSPAFNNNVKWRNRRSPSYNREPPRFYFRIPLTSLHISGCTPYCRWSNRVPLSRAVYIIYSTPVVPVRYPVNCVRTYSAIHKEMRNCYDSASKVPATAIRPSLLYICQEESPFDSLGCPHRQG